jgi:hypothetical protein
VIQSAEAVVGHRGNGESFHDPLVQNMKTSYTVDDTYTTKYLGTKKVVDFILAQEADPPDKIRSYVEKPLKPPNIATSKEVLKATPELTPLHSIDHATVKKNTKPRVKFRNKREVPPEDPT